MNEKVTALLSLSHEIGREDRQLAILGEGNTSVRLDDEQFAVKASGSCLATLTAADVSMCDMAKVLAIFDRRNLAEADIDQLMLDARVGGAGRKPTCL